MIYKFNIFLFICWLHFIEHIIQILQLYIFKIPRSQAFGMLGYIFPGLMKSEVLHFGYAFIMLIGLYYFLDYVKRNKWWVRALYIQIFHFIEHIILLSQAIIGIEMINRISIGGLFFPRAELHFFYNLIVIIPMAISLYKNERTKYI